MKGLILAGGHGTRLRPLTHTGPKQLIPLANKPNILYCLEDLRDAGITDIGVILGDVMPEKVKELLGDGGAHGVRITYVVQGFPAGIAHAIRCAESFLGDEPFCVYLGDNVLKGGIRSMVREFEEHAYEAEVMLCHVPNPDKFGVAELDPKGHILSLVEKPKEPKSDLALVGIYFFDRRIHAATDAISPSWRGELEITDAIRGLLEAGEQVRPYILQGWWIDTGKMEDLLDANRLVLQELMRRIDGNVAEDCIVQGRVVVEAGAGVVNSTLRGPLIVGARTRIENAYIGPFTAIGADCLIRDSEIEHAIVMERSQILDVPHRIEDSLIGRDVTIVRSQGKPKAYKLMLGDHSKVGIL
jgi:glucose-1-phosphate thymidylyltransferase